MKDKNKTLIGVIEQGTNVVRFSIYKTPNFDVVAEHSIKSSTVTSQKGWMEIDPIELINDVKICTELAISKLGAAGHASSELAAIGITNQRDTTFFWDSETGKPFCNGLVWRDPRGKIESDRFLTKYDDINYFKHRTGLPILPYFPAMKFCWIREHVKDVALACQKGTCRMGTAATWIIWNLTNGALHITDPTNASHSFLMNIETLNWDPVLLKEFNIDKNMLPKICSNSEIYGRVTNTKSPLFDLPISGIIGNHPASLVGQLYLRPGMVRIHYGHGGHVICNTGSNKIISKYGLSTTVAYKLGANESAAYALEGGFSAGEKTLKWLTTATKILPDITKAEEMGNAVPTTGDVYFVPCFGGLRAPYWHKNARGIICGITQFTTKQHIVRAVFESICFQARDILEIMYLEGQFDSKRIFVDGNMAEMKLLVQLQSDLTGSHVLRPKAKNTAALGAAACAANAKDIDLYKIDPRKEPKDNNAFDMFLPTCSDEERTTRYSRWLRAVKRSRGWAKKSISTFLSEEHYRLLTAIPVSIYFLISFLLLGQAIKQGDVRKDISYSHY